MAAVIERSEAPGTSIVPATPLEILQVAIQQSVDLDRLRVLMDLQDRWEANQAKRAFNEALAAFKKNPPVVVKDMLNKQFGSKYSSIGNLVNTVNAALGNHGLSASWDIEQDEVIRVTCILEHPAGHSRKVTMTGPPDESGSKNTLQQIRSTVTYLKIGTFEAVTGIASVVGNSNDDGNGANRQQTVQSPAGYDNWKADMRAKAEEGSEKLQESWKASSDEFRRHVVKHDELWWSETKRKAAKVQA